MPTIVADLGNSRLKWGRIGPDGSLLDVASLPLDDQDGWLALWNGWNLDSATAWWISSVNPPLAERLHNFLGERGVHQVHWMRSAADVPLHHELEQASTAGADRALAVLGALDLREACQSCLVVLCGTAITVERINVEGVWQGGAITLGLGMTARALHVLTAQLPLVHPGPEPPAWGRSTRPALEAGVYWGVVGAIRELLGKQATGFDSEPRILWTGGDAPRLAPAVAGAKAEIVPDLVLRGLARLAARPLPPEV